MSNNLKEEPRLSGAYIRTLVKQLTPSRTKDPKNGQKFTKLSQGLSEPAQTHQPKLSQQHKKQVRRRHHTTKPYQERLLNMAEARREIVTALKFHRASMKQANEQQEQQLSQSQSQSSNLSSPSSTSNLTAYPQHHPYPLPSNPYSCPVDTLDFTLPYQTLGLNLNFHGFNNIETNLYHNSCNNPSMINSSSSTPPCVTQEVTSELGENHEMEWNDTENLVTSSWWLNFLKSMELGVPEMKPEDDDGDDGFQLFDQIMESPAWLKPNDTCLQQHFNDLCPDDYFQVPALPCMDIENLKEWMMRNGWLDPRILVIVFNLIKSLAFFCILIVLFLPNFADTILDTL